MEYQQIDWDELLIDDCRELIRLSVREDLDRSFDITTLALVPHDAQASASLVVREPGVVCGLRLAQLVCEEMDIPATWTLHASDGDAVTAETCIAQFTGPARDLLTAERPILNFLGHLSGIASLTNQFVDAVQGHTARIYDTRKTTPGWRRLEKYAVRCGGGSNHRVGLFDAVLIKDNHLAELSASNGDASPANAVKTVRRFLANNPLGRDVIVEIEVDTLDQLRNALSVAPDIVLLDNMPPADLRQAVALRDAAAVSTELEASGGITLSTVASVAGTGIDRISVGALTHSAISLDIGLDW